ncbi:MAG: hypothetical protein M3Z03_12635 [Actinomycetota bacterium]|nr:hypothetical protein [Actinomycetota bacterium]
MSAACSDDSSETSCAPTDDVIVAVRTPDEGDDQITLLETDGKWGRQLSPENQNARSPSFSPDGRRVVVERADGGWGDGGPYATALGILAVTGSEFEMITGGKEDDGSWPPEEGHFDADPDWSPRGDSIAFTRNGRLHLVEPGERSRPLTESEGDRGPSWSPDGERIAFIRAEGERLGLWSIDRDGANERELTQIPSPPRGGLDVPIREFARLTWSPDGERIYIDGTPLLIADVESGDLTDAGGAVTNVVFADDARVYAVARDDESKYPIYNTGSAMAADGTITTITVLSREVSPWRLMLATARGSEFVDASFVGDKFDYGPSAGLDVHACG